MVDQQLRKRKQGESGQQSAREQYEQADNQSFRFGPTTAVALVVLGIAAGLLVNNFDSASSLQQIQRKARSPTPPSAAGPQEGDWCSASVTPNRCSGDARSWYVCAGSKLVFAGSVADPTQQCYEQIVSGMTFIYIDRVRAPAGSSGKCKPVVGEGCDYSKVRSICTANRRQWLVCNGVSGRLEAGGTVTDATLMCIEQDVGGVKSVTTGPIPTISDASGSTTCDPTKVNSVCKTPFQVLFCTSTGTYALGAPLSNTEQCSQSTNNGVTSVSIVPRTLPVLNEQFDDGNSWSLSGGFTGIGGGILSMGTIGSLGTATYTPPLNTVAGRVYVLAISLSASGGNTGSDNLYLRWNGVNVFAIRNVISGGFGPTQFSVQVTATGSDSLVIAAQNDPSFYFIDWITLQ